MHAVRCPNCHKVLRLPKAVQDARMRCKHCKEIFVGTSQEVAEAAPISPPAKALQTPPQPLQSPSPLQTPPPAAAPPPGPRGAVPRRPPRQPCPPGGERDYGPMHYRPRRRKVGPWPLVIVCIAFVGIVAAGIFAVWRSQRRRLILWDENGNVVVDRLVLNDQYDKEKAKEEAKLTGKPVGSDKGTSSSPPGGADPERLDEPRRPESRRPEPLSPSSPKPPGESIPPDDDNLRVLVDSKPITGDETPTSGYLAGKIESRYPNAIAGIQVSVYTRSPSGTLRRPMLATVTFVPPGATVPFSVDYSGLPSEDIGQAIGRAKVYTPAPANVVAWVVPEALMRCETTSREITADVTLSNTTGQDVRNVQVYYDVFNQQGVRINRQTLQASGAPDSLAAGAKAKCTIRFRPGSYGSAVSLVGSWFIRVWGQK